MSESDTTEKLSFEQALEQLEKIVESLESGDTPLSELVDRYEQGTRLIEHCRSKLNDAEIRIQKISETKDGVTVENLVVDS